MIFELENDTPALEDDFDDMQPESNSSDAADATDATNADEDAGTEFVPAQTAGNAESEGSEIGRAHV